MKGAVPGSDKAYVHVVDAEKRTRPESAPFPAGIKKSAAKQEAVAAAEQPAADAAPAAESKSE